MKKIIVSLTIVIALMLSACSNNSIPPINITIPEDTINEMANKLSKEMESVMDHSLNKAIEKMQQNEKDLQTVPKPRKVLLVVIANAETYSDSIQVNNALQGGGQIYASSYETLYNIMPLGVGMYGAADGNSNMYMFGTILNYIARRGWEFKQHEIDGKEERIYFVQ